MLMIFPLITHGQDFGSAWLNIERLPPRAAVLPRNGSAQFVQRIVSLTALKDLKDLKAQLELMVDGYINPFINRQTFLLTPGIEDDSHLA